MPDLSLSVLTYLGASWTDVAAGATIFLLKKFIVVVAVLSMYHYNGQIFIHRLYLYISRYFQVLGKTAL